MRRQLHLLGAMLALATAMPAHAAGNTETVGTALVLAVDVSESVDSERYALQMEGIARAFEDAEVRTAILAGPGHAVFVSLVEWSNKPTVSIPWTLVTSAADAQAFADQVRRTPRASNGFTCMARALEFVADKVLPFLPAPANKNVIDVSGDGQDNCNTKPSIDDVKTDLVGSGTTINGLPILEGSEAETLAPWYKAHVVGGTGAFLIPARGYGDFPRAMREKFLSEISSVPTRIRTADTGR